MLALLNTANAFAVSEITKNILSQSSLTEELSLKMEDLLKISENLNQVASYYKT
jgi:hypothetical protein